MPAGIEFLFFYTVGRLEVIDCHPAQHNCLDCLLYPLMVSLDRNPFQQYNSYKEEVENILSNYFYSDQTHLEINTNHKLWEEGVLGYAVTKFN